MKNSSADYVRIQVLPAYYLSHWPRCYTFKGNLEEAVNETSRKGYSQGYLRKSVVSDPLKRVNTGDNTPAMIYYDICPGDKLKITVAPKALEARI